VSSRSGRGRLALLLVLVFLGGATLLHHDMPKDGDDMGMSAICLAVLGGAAGFAVLAARARPQRRIARYLRPFLPAVTLPVASVPARAGPFPGMVVLRR
jgi:peptidoglycan/LPS O-acetylase OafA/YrhL